ncbi:DUF58 domain-containing protein [Skermania sp. ID1734]|uniref:DUF58 domain-containing protein n=1 Tax=Skermania sp. ID1734 TaxID=2597516 RepID=UPI00117CD361|nr:DUF58 domain-containing protein [Skermania sp. ID1734]TSD95648.1 DUF58 domain-containing protein [Skermania sp. ID1734]
MTEGRVEVPLHWRASPLMLALATCAAAALAVAVAASAWQVAAFAAPLLGVLASIGWQRPRSVVYAHADVAEIRCFEGETVTMRVWASTKERGIALAVSVVPMEGLEVQASAEESDAALELSASAQRWGRYPIGLQVQAVGASGLLTATEVAVPVQMYVFPLVGAQPTTLPRTELPDRLGVHLTRHKGPGVEYADVREYVPGDQLRTINWSVSARRGSLHVTERLTDRAADVVVLIDTYAQAPGPATAATERVVRGAAQVVQTALRNGDRAGIVALGGRRPRWLGADIGRRQFYRVLDAVLAVGGEYETTTGTLAPRAAVPSGAILVAFSTMLDTEFALALIDLRKRGHMVVAVDVLEGAPFEEELEPMVARMWALERSAMYRDMGTVGVDIVSWHGDITLDQAMQLVPVRRRPARRKR